MRYILALAMLASIGGSAIALTDDQGTSSAVNSQRRSVSATEITAKLDKLGYDVRRLKTGKNHYEAYMVERASGGAVKATFSKASGDLLGAKLAENEYKAREREEVRDRKETQERRESREQQESRERGEMRKHQESRKRESQDKDN
jgi:hypothetical protein